MLWYPLRKRTIIMLVEKNRTKDICDYIDHPAGEERTVFAIQVDSLKKNIEKSIRSNNVITNEIEFILKRL